MLRDSPDIGHILQEQHTTPTRPLTHARRPTSHSSCPCLDCTWTGWLLRDLACWAQQHSVLTPLCEFLFFFLVTQPLTETPLTGTRAPGSFHLMPSTCAPSHLCHPHQMWWPVMRGCFASMRTRLMGRERLGMAACVCVCVCDYVTHYVPACSRPS